MIILKDVITGYPEGEEFSIPEARFEEGRVTAVIGRNGSGKSTLLRTMAGQLRYRGSIRLDGEECRELTPAARARKAAYLPQMLRSAQMDVQTLVEHGRYAWHGALRRMTEKDREKVERAMERAGVTAYRDRLLTRLSGGERQRAYLAMVIAQDAPMILLDEPTTYMDPGMQEALFRLLRSLAEEGRGIVTVCHDLPQTFSFCDRICVMAEHTLCACGTPEELARQEELLRRTLGVSLKNTGDQELVFPWAVKR
ncbi:MAG: ABC transporter ATP-binding protein [Clostridia bacterium]|nr:ABC transporter ATP-binding protein [Clostridia bacterium]